MKRDAKRVGMFLSTYTARVFDFFTDNPKVLRAVIDGDDDRAHRLALLALRPKGK